MLQAKSDQCRARAVTALKDLYQRHAVASPIAELNKITRSNVAINDRDVGDFCKSAVAYRENLRSFAEVAHFGKGKANSEWICNSCKRNVSRASLSILPATSFWIGPSGFFKAHC